MKRSLDESSHKHLETCYISAIKNAFLDQKRVNVCEHAVMMAPCEYHQGVEGVEGMEGNSKGNYLRLIPGLCLEDRTN